jgi:hypothetical protein
MGRSTLQDNDHAYDAHTLAEKFDNKEKNFKIEVSQELLYIFFQNDALSNHQLA